MQVIKATLEHLLIIAPLFDAYRVFNKYESDPECALEFLFQAMANESLTFFLAFAGEGSDSEAIGFAELNLLKSPEEFEDYWVLNDLFVLEEYDREKICRMLLAHCIAFARHEGSTILALETAGDIYPSLEFFQENGFAPDEDEIRYIKRL